MSVTFNGMREYVGSMLGPNSPHATVLREPIDDPEEGPDDPGFNLNNGNAHLFLSFLDLHHDAVCLSGQASLAEARRAVIKARATFDRHVDDYTREASDTKPPGKVRVIEAGVDRDYFKRRMEGFAALIERLDKAGATHITWG